MLTKRAIALCVLFACVAAGAGTARAQINQLPRELDDISIVDKPGSPLPLDVTLVDHVGQTVKLAEYFDGKTPTIVVMAYYSCPMLCTLVLNGVTRAIKDLAFQLGTDFRVLVVSIDPKDTQDVAAAKRTNYVAAYGKDAPGRSYDFLRGQEADVRRLADAIGFRYRWDEEGKQYAHAAAAFLVTPKGILSRTLYGIQFETRDMRLGLIEASQGKLGSSIDRLTLFCFHYDPAKRSYVLAAKNIMRGGGVLTMFALGILLTLLWRRYSPQHAPVPPSSTTRSTEQSV